MEIWQYNYGPARSDELYHWGIKGMKWGVRRYQNEDGSLTPAGKKRYSKEYTKLMKKAKRNVSRAQLEILLQAEDKAYDDMYNGEFDKFNARQKEKYGENYMDRKGYSNDYSKELDRLFEKNVALIENQILSNDENYKKAQELVKKYNMREWSKLVK